MARYRTIKPEFWTDSKTGTLSDRAKVLFIGLLNYADDYGFIRFDIQEFKARIFPYAGSPPADLLADALCSEIFPRGLARILDVDRIQYLHITNFEKHQKVDKPGKPLLPGWKSGMTIEEYCELSDDYQVLTGMLDSIPDGHDSSNPRESSRDLPPECSKSVVKDILSSKPDNGIPVKEIIAHLNEKTGKSFSPTTKETIRHIKARINEGYSLADFITVIDTMTVKWRGDPKMIDYLRPQTLFGTKFESYLNIKQPNNKSDPFKD